MMYKDYLKKAFEEMPDLKEEYDKLMPPTYKKMIMSIHDIFNNNGRSENEIISISHNDLDGFGATIALKVMSTIPECIMENYANMHIVNTGIMTKNPRTTDTSSTYDVLEDVISNSLKNENCKNLSIFITDLANFYVSEILWMLRTFPEIKERGIKLKIIIVDHHHCVYVDDPNGCEASGIYLDDYHHDEVVFKAENEFTAHCFNWASDDINIFNFVSYDYSAAYLINVIAKDYQKYVDEEQTSISCSHSEYWEPLNTYIPDIHIPKAYMERLENFTAAVSKYDTGHWSDWKWDTKTPMVIPNFDIILFLWWKTSMDSMYSGFNMSALSEFTNSVFKFIMNENTPKSCFPKKKVYDKLYLINQQYGKFDMNFVNFYKNSASTITVNDINMKIPSIYANREMVFAVPRRYSKFEPGIPYSLFAKKYLEDHPNVNILMSNNPKYRTATMYARNDGDIDVSIIAKENGGGGHSAAAGFSY